MSAPLACPKCSEPWPATAAELAALTACPSCAREVRALAFPALFRPAPPVAAALPNVVVSEGEASCFYHATKRAVVPCGACGRFLCALCEVKLGGRSLCPACLESGRSKNKFTELESSRVLWDTGALMLAVVPLVLCGYFSILTAPAALVVAWLGRNKPSSIVPRGKGRWWAAVIIAVLQIIAWITLTVLFFTGAFD